MFYKELSNEELRKYPYPNLIAEFIESNYSICTLGSHMGIGKRCQEDDPEVWSKLRGDKEITTIEALGLARLFNAKFEYLFSHELQLKSEKPIAYWRWYDYNKRREQEIKNNRMLWDIYGELKEKPHLLSFIKDMLTLSEDDRLHVIQLLADLRRDK